MKTIAMSLAALSLAILGWQWGPSYTNEAQLPVPVAERAQSIDMAALHAEARAALRRLQEKQRTHVSMTEPSKPASIYR